MDYVLIKNGEIVVNGIMQRQDVLIGNEKIIEIGDSIERPEPETPVIDALGKYLLPGAVDTNIIFSDLIKQDVSALKRFNQAQIICGTTTVIEPIIPLTSFSYKEELQGRKKMDFGIKSDYGFHLSINNWDVFASEDLEYCYAHEGIASFYLRWPVRKGELKGIPKLLKSAAKANTPVLIDMQKPGEGEEGQPEMSKVYNETITNHLSQLRAVLDYAVEAGCIVCVLNVCFKEELILIEKLSDSGLVYAEVLFPFHIANSDKIFVDNNSIYSGFPLINKLNLLSEEDIWKCLRKDNYFISRPKVKLSGQGVLSDSQVDNRPDEYILLKNLLSVLYTWGVAEKNFSMVDLVDLIAVRTARFMGLYPRKGILQTGSDADIIIWNPDYRRNLYCHLPGVNKEEVKSFPLEGRVEFVFVKGGMVYNGESYSADKVKGKYLYRSPCI
ncbi:MAG: amidohydrolase family protein [Carboxylicivirga sp.]|jgi:dihydroorotase-like cyclic amidohydrolase|nr:amidohydrolase family protein [Carboxylicivirga sp.]